MERQFNTCGTTTGALVLDVPDDRWSARISCSPGLGETSLLLSLPRGLFVAHDAAMCRLGAYPGPVVESDAEYLSDVWGFTTCSFEGHVQEVGEVSLITVRNDPRGFVVELAGVPWLVRDRPLQAPALPGASAPEPLSLLGICFGVDLDAFDGEERFMGELACGQAVVGQVRAACHP